ncbi:hypothetical protein BLA39750_01011 [Burkholderia lata]|uniref:Uncharacterized protein n=2 Tax=Burkholderia lata (strain ATCC 17760 / DSM 23089 / LMG 22485 / NCIMB 9086 / R18194 / 383) TaxID=482957 RepID=A0A6P2UN19_BURL3|nr:hypothetical protein BLA39750_01011 [Burkholderia lata]
MVEGPDLDKLIDAAGVRVDVWENLLFSGPVTMITIEAVRKIMKLNGTPEALKFIVWLDRQYPANAALAALDRGDLTSDCVLLAEQMYLKNPDIQTSEIASRLKISENEARVLHVQIIVLHKLNT